MKEILSLIGAIAALVMCAVSAAMNYLFLSSLGKTPLEGQVLGAASAAADVLKALLPFFIAWSWQSRRFVATVSGSLAFGFFAGFSLLSAIGFAADNRGVLTQQRHDLTSTYIRMQGIREHADKRRDTLPPHRPAAIVTEEIERHRQNRRWGSTTACTDATEVLSREYCADYFSLRAELAAAQESERLASEIKALDAELARLRAKGAGQDSDPQVSLLSRIMGQEKEPVHLALIIAVALLVEIGASLGLFLAGGHKIKHEVTAGAPDRPVGSVEDFCLEALVPSPTLNISTSAMHGFYRQWCDRRDFAALPHELFDRDFGEIARQVCLRNQDDFYLGVAPASIETSIVLALPLAATDRVAT